MTNFITKIVAWIKAGYPDGGVPHPDQVPLFALLRRRLSDDEVLAVANALLERGAFDHIDIGGVLITEITDALPTPEDIDRSMTGCPRSAGRWTIRETVRTSNNNSASTRHPAGPVGAVVDGRPGWRPRRTRCAPPGADPPRG